MTDNTAIKQQNAIDGPSTTLSDQMAVRAQKSLTHIVEFFRLTTVHEIRSSLILALLDLYPNSLIAVYDLSSSGKYNLSFCNSPKELVNPEFIDPRQFRLRQDSNSMYLSNYAEKTKLLSVFKGTTSLAAVGQFMNEKLGSLLILENPLAGVFSQFDIEILSQIYEATTLAQKRATLFEILEMKVEKQNQLLESISEIFQNSSQSGVYQAFLNSICRTLKIDHALLEVAPMPSLPSVDSEKEKSF